MLYFITTGCEKSESSKIDLASAEMAAFKKKAAQLGRLHNEALSYVATKHDIASLSIPSFRSTIYNFAPMGSGFTFFDSKFHFDSKGLSFDQLLDKYFKANTAEFRALLRKAKNDVQHFTEPSNYHAYYDRLVDEVAGNSALSEQEKWALILGFEVARNSGLYWYQARSSKSNPYHVLFSNGIQQQNFPCMFCGMSCEQLEDMLATISAFGYYQSGGYNDNQPAITAIQDGQFHSGLAVMPEGACH